MYKIATVLVLGLGFGLTLGGCVEVKREIPQCYPDVDNDGFGDPSRASPREESTVMPGYFFSCDYDMGWIDDGTDCDDLNSRVHPGAAEVCDDEVDNDCDDLTTDAGGGWWYADGDGDGYGGEATIVACEAPDGYVSTAGDCDDDDYDIHPDADEYCNDTDDNCNGVIDGSDESVDVTFYFEDVDGDGFAGSYGDILWTCGTPPDGYYAARSDCDDYDAAVNPDEVEVCDDEVDNDCDDEVDNDDSECDGG